MSAFHQVIAMVSPFPELATKMEQFLLQNEAYTVFRLKEEELKNSCFSQRPLCIIWDERQPAADWNQVLRWFRDRNKGLPVLVVLSPEQACLEPELARIGMNQIIYYPSAGFQEQFIVFVNAITDEKRDSRLSAHPFDLKSGSATYALQTTKEYISSGGS